jgi:hypothetical protein
VIGTASVGSQYLFLPPDYDPEDEPWELTFELSVVVNRFLTPKNISGQCRAYFYSYYGDREAGGRGVLYADGSGRPTYRKSSAESKIDFDVRAGKPAGWRSGTFHASETIPAGSYIWFGAYSDYYFYPRFDYGGTLQIHGLSDFGDDVPAVFQIFDTYNVKPSMYFEYSDAQNYVRTLTQ